MREIFKNDWQKLLNLEMEKPYYTNMRELLIKEYNEQKIYPKMEDIFNAFHYTSFKDVKVLLLGQDPYHGENQAHGLAFSVKDGVAIPPSLRNIFKELKSDLDIDTPKSGNLKRWTQEGVMLLNTTLTVRAGQPMSHSKIGWEIFTDRVIELLNEREQPVVFILWGAHARSKKSFITNNRHFIIESPHPSPFSANRGFLGSRPFSRTNNFLKNIGEEEIDWNLGG